MQPVSQADKAAIFRRLHDRTRILVLPNAWDVASARIFEEEGFAAIGTTSAGVAASLGYPDGERISRDEMVEALGRMVRAVRVPVTADIEAGFGADPRAVAATVLAVIAAGVVGINLEDGIDSSESPLRDVAGMIERIKAAREAAAAGGVAMVINARTDVYLRGVGEEKHRFGQAVDRANAYRLAGADCLFVPGVRDASTIAALVMAINGPINVLAAAGTPPIPELERLGVARVSMGSGPMRAALTLTRRIAQELRGPGTFTAFTQDTITHAEVNQLLARKSV